VKHLIEFERCNISTCVRACVWMSPVPPEIIKNSTWYRFQLPQRTAKKMTDEDTMTYMYISFVDRKKPDFQRTVSSICMLAWVWIISGKWEQIGYITSLAQQLDGTVLTTYLLLISSREKAQNVVDWESQPQQFSFCKAASTQMAFLMENFCRYSHFEGVIALGWCARKKKQKTAEKKSTKKSK